MKNYSHLGKIDLLLIYDYLVPPVFLHPEYRQVKNIVSRTVTFVSCCTAGVRTFTILKRKQERKVFKNEFINKVRSHCGSNDNGKYYAVAVAM